MVASGPLFFFPFNGQGQHSDHYSRVCVGRWTWRLQGKGVIASCMEKEKGGGGEFCKILSIGVGVGEWVGKKRSFQSSYSIRSSSLLVSSFLSFIILLFTGSKLLQHKMQEMDGLLFPPRAPSFFPCLYNSFFRSHAIGVSLIHGHLAPASGVFNLS